MNSKLLLLIILSVSLMCLAQCQQHVCAASERNHQCFAYNPSWGCLCTAPNQCRYTQFDSCSVCNNRTVYSYYANQRCPVTNTNRNYWKPNRCPVSLDNVRCPTARRTSCACYKDGSCRSIYSTLCRACANSNILSFNYGERCPVVNNKISICPRNPSNDTVCLQYVTQGCKCFTDGSCQKGDVNSCSNCQNTDVTLVVENGNCPTRRS